MSNANYFQTMRDNFTVASQRFPLAFLSAFINYILVLFFSDKGFPLCADLALFSTLLFSISIVCNLYYETQNKKLSHANLIATGITAFIYLYFRFYPLKYVGDLIALEFGITLLFFTAPFFRLRDNEKLSFYWQKLISAGFFAGLNFLIFCCGISLVFACINVLFDDIIPDVFYEKLWQFGFVIFGPLAFLSMLPKIDEINAVPVCNSPKSLKITISWLFIPVCLMFVAVLYAYFVKAALTAEVPKTVFVAIVINISLLSIFVYLVSYPLIHENNGPAKFIQRYIFPLLVIPSLVLAWRFYVRIANHGMTEERFYAAMIIVWLLINIFYQIVQHRKTGHDLRVPLFTAAILLLITAISPYSPARFHYEEKKQIPVVKIIENGNVHGLFGSSYSPKEKITRFNYSLSMPENTVSNIVQYQYEIPNIEKAESKSALGGYSLDNGLSVRILDNKCLFGFYRDNQLYKSVQLPCKEKLAELIKDSNLKASGNNGYIYKNLDRPFSIETTEGNIRVRMIFTSIEAMIDTNDLNAGYQINTYTARMQVGIE